MAIDCMANIQNVIYNLNWYESPMELQKNSILIMAQSQRKFYFTGFNLMRCTLFNFQRVIFLSLLRYFSKLCLGKDKSIFQAFSFFSANQIIGFIFPSIQHHKFEKHLDWVDIFKVTIFIILFLFNQCATLEVIKLCLPLILMSIARYIEH